MLGLTLFLGHFGILGGFIGPRTGEGVAGGIVAHQWVAGSVVHEGVGIHCKCHLWSVRRTL